MLVGKKFLVLMMLLVVAVRGYGMEGCHHSWERHLHKMPHADIKDFSVKQRKSKKSFSYDSQSRNCVVQKKSLDRTKITDKREYGQTFDGFDLKILEDAVGQVEFELFIETCLTKVQAACSECRFFSSKKQKFSSFINKLRKFLLEIQVNPGLITRVYLEKNLPKLLPSNGDKLQKMAEHLYMTFSAHDRKTSQIFAALLCNAFIGLAVNSHSGKKTF